MTEFIAIASLLFIFAISIFGGAESTKQLEVKTSSTCTTIISGYCVDDFTPGEIAEVKAELLK